jgi:hypothetical protein
MGVEGLEVLFDLNTKVMELTEVCDFGFGGKHLHDT